MVVPLNPLYSELELQHALNECGAETIVALSMFHPKVKQVQPRTALERVIVTHMEGTYFPPAFVTRRTANLRQVTCRCSTFSVVTPVKLETRDARGTRQIQP